MRHVHAPHLTRKGWIELRLVTYILTVAVITAAASAWNGWAWAPGIALIIAEMIFFGYVGTGDQNTEGDGQ